MTKQTVKRKPAKRKPARRKTNTPGLWQRLMKLVPFTEQQVQRALTMGMVAIAVLGIFVFGHYSGINGQISDEMAEGVRRGGFEVRRVEVTGVTRIDEMGVYEVALSQKDRSMLRVDVDALRDELMTNGWIKDARVTRRLPDMLAIDVVEREPIAIWQRNGKLSLIDRTGETLENLDESELPDMPIVMGEKANEQAAALDALLEAAPALRPQIVSATWVGNRRWNFEFESGETLALPEGKERAAAALVEFARMDGINRLLGGKFSHFDLRNDERIYARLLKKATSKKSEDGDGS